MNPLGGIIGMRIGRAPLTTRQREIYDFIVQQFRATQATPTLREIMARFDISSTNGVTDHLVSMERKGWIEWRRRGRSRGIKVLTETGCCALCGRGGTKKEAAAS